MMRKFLMRYIILILFLILCAGAAWYLTNRSAPPYEDAVLAQASLEQENENAE